MRREITKEQYERAMQNRGYVAGSDRKDIFTEPERCGYGVYSPVVEQEGDKYYVNFWLGSTCD